MSGGILGDLTGTFRDVSRTTRALGRAAQDTARAAGDITGADDAYHSQDARYRVRGYRDRERADRAEDRYNDYRDQRNGYDRDDRAAPYRGGGGQGPERLGSRGTGSRGQVDGREQATIDFVHAMEAANAAAANSPERAAALRDARAILDNQYAGLKSQDGSIHFPPIQVPGPNGPRSGITFGVMNGRDYSSYPSAEAAMQQLTQSLNGIGVGTQIPLEEIRRANGAAAPIVSVGTGQPPATRDPATAAPIVSVGTGQPPATRDPATAAPVVSTGTGQPPATRDPATAAAASQKEMNQQAQVALERLGISTGNRNHAAFNANNGNQNPASLMDGIVGPKTGPGLVKIQQMLGMEQTGQVSPELLSRLSDQTVMADLARRLDAERSGRPITHAVPATTTADPASASQPAPAGQDVALTNAVSELRKLDTGIDKADGSVLTSVNNGAALSDGKIGFGELQGISNRQANGEAFGAATVATHTARRDALRTAMDLNHDGTTSNDEVNAVVTAARAQGLTVDGAALTQVLQSGNMAAHTFTDAEKAAADTAVNTAMTAAVRPSTAAPTTPSELFAGRGFSPEIKEAALAGMGFTGVVRDERLSPEEIAMGGKLEVAAGTVGMVDDREALGRLNEAAAAARSSGTTLAAKAQAGQVYNPTSHEFTAAPQTPDARPLAGRDASAGFRV